MAKNVAFVLGAGSSVQFNFPTGIKLIKLIYGKLDSPISYEYGRIGNSMVERKNFNCQLLEEFGFKEQEIKYFTNSSDISIVVGVGFEILKFRAGWPHDLPFT